MPNARRRKSYLPNIVVTISLTIALFLIGLCGLLTLVGKRLSDVVKQNVEMQVYLNQDLPPATIDSLRGIIMKKPYVALRNNQPQVTYVSKDEAAKRFLDDTGEDFTQFLGENPLHDAFTIKTSENYFSESGLKNVQADLKKLKGVFEVEYVRNFVDDVNRNLAKIYLVLAVFVVLLLIVIVVLINNTIKLSLYSQRFTIRSMQLVGATNGFIRVPFLRKGLWQGLLSAVLACGLLYGTVELASRYVDGFGLLLDDPMKVLLLFGGLVQLGLLIGFLSTLQSVQRYMGLSQNELY